MKAILKLSYLRAGFMSFFFSSSAFISFFTFMTYVVSGHYLTAQKVFTCIALFNSARIVMTLYFPIGITLFNEARVSIERMRVSIFCFRSLCVCWLPSCNPLLYLFPVFLCLLDVLSIRLRSNKYNISPSSAQHLQIFAQSIDQDSTSGQTNTTFH